MTLPYWQNDDGARSRGCAGCPMSEQELFSAYRNTEGYTTDCACGDQIFSAQGSESAVAGAVRLHNESPIHQQWAGWQEAVHALQRPARKPCPCHNHGGAA